MISDPVRRAALAAAPAMPPNTLSLPTLGVGPVGTGPVCAEPSGILEPPSTGPMTCTWRGSVPLDASSGSFTEASHINYDGRQGSFSRLSQMLPGDVIYTRGKAGTQAWVVTREVARSKALPLDAGAFMGPEGPRQLVLLSCGGALSGRSYVDNIYVFATPI